MQSRRPDRLPDVPCRRVHGVRQPRRQQRHVLVRLNRLLLRVQGDGDENHREHQQRQFLTQHLPPGTGRIGFGRAFAPTATAQPGHGDAAERPAVEQHQQHRQRDQRRFRQQPRQHRGTHAEIPGHSRRPAITFVGQQRHAQQQDAQNVLAFRHPNDAFDPQRMHGEEQHSGRAPPGRGRHPHECDEERRDRRRVEQHVAQVIAGRPGADDHRVDLVRHHRQRGPTADHGVCTCPADARGRHAVKDRAILVDVGGVVPVDKVTGHGGEEDGRRQAAEQAAHEPRAIRMLQARYHSFHATEYRNSKDVVRPPISHLPPLTTKKPPVLRPGASVEQGVPLTRHDDASAGHS